MEAFFLPALGGQRLCIHHAPAGRARGAVLYLHPWAEEMNKSRRMAAMAARAMAGAGWAVLQIDLHGCGDSSGDFADARWDGWVDDALLGARWLQQRHPGARLMLWGLRGGALLAGPVAARLDAPCGFLFWQPATSGQAVLKQFLRLKAAAEMQQGDARGTLERARSELAGGRCIDVAGYRLSPALAAGLEQAMLDLPARALSVAWLEVSTREPAVLLPASAACVESWRASGRAVTAQAVPGPSFWQTQEIEDAPALLDATLTALAGQGEMEPA